MKQIILFLIIVCAAFSSMFFYAAGVVASKSHWATLACAAVGDLCHRPLLLCGDCGCTSVPLAYDGTGGGGRRIVLSAKRPELTRPHRRNSD